jgi:hypothetical protein
VVADRASGLEYLASVKAVADLTFDEVEVLDFWGPYPSRRSTAALPRSGCPPAVITSATIDGVGLLY